MSSNSCSATHVFERNAKKLTNRPLRRALNVANEILLRTVLKLAKEETFFTLLDSQAQVAVRAAETFANLVGDLNRVQELCDKLLEIEREGDEVTHRLQTKLSAAFITPLDQEDLSSLSHVLDDITDCVEAVGARIGMYRLTTCRPDLVPFAANLLEATQVIAVAISELHKQFHRSETLPVVLVKIHTLENESDQIYRTALTNLFDEESNPIMVLKWKEVYDRVEHALDKCETLANIVDNMIVKYA